MLNQEFAEKAYTAAMASLEHARSEASRTQSYLAIYGQPSVAEEASLSAALAQHLGRLHPRLVLWAIGMLGVLTIRDHVR